MLMKRMHPSVLNDFCIKSHQKILLIRIKNKQDSSICQNPQKKRRAITALPNTETGFIAESSFITESNLMLSTLPALYKRGIAKMLFLSICFQSFTTLISWNEKPSLSSTASFSSSIVFSFLAIAREAKASKVSGLSKYSIPSPS